MRSEVTTEAAKSAPPALVTIWGWLNDWTINATLTKVTILYVCIQTAYLIWKWYREYKAK